MYNALVVDDNELTADTHKDVLESFDVSVTVCSTPAAGVKLLKNSPCFDLVLCDLNFPKNPRAKANTDGMAVGKWMKDNDYPTVARVSSGKFRDGDAVIEEAVEAFGGSLPPKSSINDYEAVVAQAVQKKREKLERSVLRAEPRLAQEREKALMTVHSLSGATFETGFDEHVAEGCKVLVVQPETNGFPVGLPFFVWQKDLSEGVFLEVFGQPQLMAFGDNLEQSLDILNEVVFSSYVELHEGELSGELKRLKEFLDRVYDADIASSGDWKAA